jgi:hypothetical protein
MLLEEMGKTSDGNDFLILYVSSPENLAKIEEYREISMRLSDPRGLTEGEINDLAEKGKTIVFQSYGLHSNEVGGPQMVPLMLYELLSENTPRIRKILDEVIFIILPSTTSPGTVPDTKMTCPSCFATPKPRLVISSIFSFRTSFFFNFIISPI